MHKPVIKGNFNLTGDTGVVLIVEHKYDKIQWACSASIYTASGEPDTPKEGITRPNGNLWKMSAISEIIFLSRKA